MHMLEKTLADNQRFTGSPKLRAPRELHVRQREMTSCEFTA
jgi:hypothetical protein